MTQFPDNEYFPAHIEILPIDSIRSFDVFIRIKGNMVLYHSGGDRFTAEVRDNLLMNHIDVLYIRKSDQTVYEQFLENNLGTILTNPLLSVSDRSHIAYTSITNIAKTLFDNPRSQTITRYKSAISTTLNFIMTDDAALSSLIRLTSHDFTTYIHSVNVGIFATGLAKALLADNPRHDMSELASGFFLHDIGKCSIPPELLNKPGPLSEEEWKIIRRHPFDGYKLLEKLDALTEESKFIVMEHHERHDGSGYPRGLCGDQINLYSKICIIADVFDALTAVRPYKDSKTPFLSLQIMKNEMRHEFDPNIFSRFVLMFGENSQEKSI